MQSDLADVVIAGGGPGGLSAALVLGRSLKKVIVIDEGKPRNDVTRKAHGFLTRDGMNPSLIRQIAREQLDAYKNISILKDVVEDVERKKGRFITKTKSGKILNSKKMIFATGMKDHLPAISGLQSVYGKTVFHCPYCDGWERRNEPLAVIGNGDGLLPFIKLIHNWSKDLIVFTNGPVAIRYEEKQQLAQRSIDLIESPIVELQSSNGKLENVILRNGKSFSRTGGFMVTTGEKQSSMIPARLGVPLNDKGEYESSEHGQTNLEGLFIIGDAKNTFTSLAGATSQGYEAAVKINGELAEEEWADVLLQRD
ncbi:pyridine nucleotide-disulfide oxidoreductase [Domibacillus antri]|uniref:Pyridine nucleotide-disulfide oxidoreductase n=1 Tax=Domibacillus antri TaxID=1714264 RepID=A0A1Q8Q5D6_9BACI|nr:NAD(P)/FAD-dependent oxidoreductase [Domibacillus antri]OLN22549.1 pyridine nucleotide-disulfide oxidoreductase [Domibacillus antri]